MGQLHVKYLLVGGGAASYSAAAAIGNLDPRGSIMLVGQEINRPYNRSALSKSFLRRQEARSALFTCEPDWYSVHGVQLRTGCRAAHLDSARSVVTLDNGDAVSYDRLLLATGSLARPLSVPGQYLANVFSPRTIEDYEQLLMAVGKARIEGHLKSPAAPGAPTRGAGRGVATVIGAGLLGVEIAAGLAQAGLAVDLVASGPCPWSRFAGEGTGRFLSRFLSEHGVKIHAGARAVRIDGDGRAQRVVLADGAALVCDFVVSAVGSVPNKELLRGAGVIAENAILTDEHCRTNVADIWAAGDCAAVRHPLTGKYRAPEQWDGAAVTGTIAGTNMAGDDATLQSVASFSTEILGLAARGWGQARHVVRRVTRGAGNVESANFAEIGITADDRIAQVLAVGPQAELPVFEELVRRCAVVGNNAEALREPGWPLENLLS